MNMEKNTKRKARRSISQEVIAFELKKEIALLDNEIAGTEALVNRREKTMADLRGHLDHLRAQRRTKEMQLAREEAPLRKPTGHEVIINDGGFLWRV